MKKLPVWPALFCILLAGCGDMSLRKILVDTVQENSNSQFVAAPVFFPSTGTYSLDQSVTITDSTLGATIYYTTNGGDPTRDSPTYTGAISVTGNGTVMTMKAIAAKAGMNTSTTVSATYAINYSQVSTPQFSPPAGGYTSVQNVTISTSTPGAAIRYTTDGSTPTSSYGTVYSGAINVTTSQTIRAIAYKTSFTDSTVPVAAYMIFPQYFVYVTTSVGVYAYGINTSTGALSAVGGSPFAAGNTPFGIAVAPTGKFVYVANEGSNNVSAYTINSSTGVLSAISGSPFTAGSIPIFISVDPTGKFVYVPNQNSTSVSAYTINSSTGVLSAVSGSPFTAGTQPTGIAVDPSGKFVYVTNLGGGVSAYTITSGTGVLSGVSGSPFATGTQPTGIAADPTGKFVYVTNRGGNNVSAYTITSGTGVLLAVSGSPFAAGTNPMGIAADPTGKFVYVANQGGGVSAYTITSGTGALSAVSGSPFAVGTGFSGIAIVKISGP